MRKEYIKLTYKNLQERGLRTLLTLVGIVIGIGAVVALISLGQGLERAVSEELLDLGGKTVTVQPKGSGFGPPGTLAAEELTEDDLQRVRRAKGVDFAFGRLIKPVEVEFNDNREVIFTATLPDDSQPRNFLLNTRDIEVFRGRMLEPGSSGVMIGNKYFREDVFDRPVRAGDKITMNNKTFDVTAVLADTGSPEVDISIQMNEDQLRDLLDVPDEYSAIVAKAGLENTSQVAANIERELRNYRDVDKGEEPFTVETSEETFQQFTTILNIIRAVLVGIAAISLLVGGINIMNAMFTTVVERTADIGVMKAVGATNEDVLVLFLLESALLGLAGGALGLTLGIALSELFGFIVAQAGFELLNPVYPTFLIIGSLTFSMVIGMISGTLPAVRASRKDPAEAVRA